MSENTFEGEKIKMEWQTTKREDIEFINNKLDLQLNLRNTTWKKLWKKEWWLQIDNSKFKSDYHLLLCDTDKGCIHYFKIPANTITNPKEIFSQTTKIKSDPPKKSAQTKKSKDCISVSNILIKRDVSGFRDYRGKQINFMDYYIMEVPYTNSNKKQLPKNSNRTAKKKDTLGKKPSTLKSNSSKNYKKIVQKTKDHIILVNEYRTKNGKKPVFKESSTLKLWRDIENLCESEAFFVIFIKSLYILFREKTRDKNLNYRNKNDHYYIYRFPEIFWEKDKITKQNMDNICIIRNNYFHSDEDEQVSKSQKTEKKSFLEVVHDFTRKKQHIPELTKDFQALQFKIMEQFEEAMRELLQMVKDE